MEINRNVANAVRAEMARSGVTQTTIGKALHLSQAAISRRLKAQVPFTVEELMQAARTIGVPVGVLIGDGLEASEPAA